MNRQTCKKIADDARRALEAVAKAHGLAVEYRGGSFDTTAATLRFQFADTGGGGIAKTPEYMALEAKAPGLAGATVPDPMGRGSVTLVGWNTKAPRYPLQFERDGKRYKAPASMLRMIQAQNNAEARGIS